MPHTNTDSINMNPIGYLRCDQTSKYDQPRQPVIENSEHIGLKNEAEIVVNKTPDELQKNYQGIIKLNSTVNAKQSLIGLDGFEMIWLIFSFHQNSHWKSMVSVPRDTPKQGVFATRSPYRPNNIGMSAVRLIKISTNKLFIGSHDLLDKTPILDIKPYIPSCDAFDVRNHSWLEQGDTFTYELSSLAQEQLAWLESHGLNHLRSFLQDQMTRDPLNKTKKRVLPTEDNGFCLSYKTWRIHFQHSKNHSRIVNISSGYSTQELNEKTDIYSDKELHKNYLNRWAK